MELRNASRAFSLAGMAMLVILQSALAEEKNGKPVKEQEDPMAWVKVSEDQKDAARKLGVPVAFTNSVAMRFVLIPPGKFKMGSADSAAEVRAKCIGVTANPDWAEDEHPAHKVELSRAFYMSIYEVTGKQLESVAPRPAETKEEKTANSRRRRGDSRAKSPVPALNVWWDEAVTFCEELSKREDRTYRLPTEAEWEYACRAGTTAPFSFGETIYTNQVNYDGSFAYGDKGEAAPRKARRGPSPVGLFPPNPWGLHDMHGNVWEWCSDWYGKYSDKSQKDPIGPSSGTGRVVRGGCWYNSPAVCRSAKRSSNAPCGSVNSVGFRVVVEAK